MRKVLLVELAAILCLLIGSPGSAQAMQVLPYTFDELGNGMWGNGTYIIGWMAPDPGPGHLPLALTYQLPFAGVVGDVLIWEPYAPYEPNGPPGPEVSDVIRFNGNSTLVFYSESEEEGGGPLADTGLPTSNHVNMVSINEIGPEGGYNFAYYTPTENEPGYDPSGPTYLFVSDIPEPSTVMLVGLGLAGLLAFKRRRA